MTRYHEKMFRIMNQFRKLNISDMLPGISRMEYLTMLIAMKAEDDRRISVSERREQDEEQKLPLPYEIGKALGDIADAAGIGAERICGTCCESGGSSQHLCCHDRGGHCDNAAGGKDHEGFFGCCWQTG